MMSCGVSLDMVRAGQTDDTESIDTVEIRAVLARRHDTVGCEQEATVECLELIDLFPPCVAVISGKMRILLEEWIVLTGEHFGVGIDIDTGSCGLFEQFMEVVQVMP